MKKIILIVIEAVIVVYTTGITLLLGGFPLNDDIAFRIEKHEWYYIALKRLGIILLVIAIAFFVLRFLNKRIHNTNEVATKWTKGISLFLLSIGLVTVSIFVITKPYF